MRKNQAKVFYRVISGAPYYLLLTILALCSKLYALEPIEDKKLEACILELMQKKQWQTQVDVDRIKCHSKKIESSKGIDQFINLTHLSLYNNRIKHIDLASLSKLEVLNLSRNNLDVLNVESLPALKKLYLTNNKLTKLTLPKLNSLILLKLNSNKLVFFSYQSLDYVKKIYIFDNKLKEFDITRLPSLGYMDCRQNPMPDSLYEKMDKVDGVTFLHDGNADDWR